MTCLEVCWDALKIYAKCAYFICILNGNVICSDPESMWMSSCVKTICDIGSHCGNDNYWSEGIKKYSCGDVYCLYDVTCNIICMNCSNCDCDICGDRIETLICCVCIGPSDGGEELIWCGVWYGISVCDDMQAYQRVVFNADSPPLYDHIHHIQSNIHLDNDMLCDLTVDIENNGFPHWTLHLL